MPNEEMDIKTLLSVEAEVWGSMPFSPNTKTAVLAAANNGDAIQPQFVEELLTHLMERIIAFSLRLDPFSS